MPLLIFIPLFVLLTTLLIYRDNFGSKAIFFYLGTYALGFGLIKLFGLSLVLFGVVGAVLVIIMFFHAKLKRFM